MKLTRKKAIALCIELWEWLAETGELKENWPGWKEYEAQNDCWFCEYDTQHRTYCRSCPLKGTDWNRCLDMYYGQWDKAKISRTRKKYAKLFLEQIKELE